MIHGRDGDLFFGVFFSFLLSFFYSSSSVRDRKIFRVCVCHTVCVCMCVKICTLEPIIEKASFKNHIPVDFYKIVYKILLIEKIKISGYY